MEQCNYLTAIDSNLNRSLASDRTEARPLCSNLEKTNGGKTNDKSKE